MKKYLFFEFDSGYIAASNKGICRAMLNTESGEIQATISYGLMSYRDAYIININDEVNEFPYCIQDRIIGKAKKCLNEALASIVA